MNKSLQALVSILLSGAAWYLAFDLSGNFGWLLWLAPIPVLYTSYGASPGRAFLFAFAAFLIGRLSWLPYLLSVLPGAAAILFTILFPAVFALLVWVQRKFVLRRPAWIAVLILPLLWTAFEFASFRLGRDGTITSIAATQANYLPVIQLVSLTGMTGLSFLLQLLPSAIAVGAFHVQRSAWPAGRAGRFLALPIGLFFGAIVFGWIRLTLNPAPMEAAAAAPSVNILLLTANESTYQDIFDKRPDRRQQITDRCLRQIDSQIRPGTGLVLLPEKAIPLPAAAERPITDTLGNIARRHQVTLIAGYTRIRSDHRLDNGALVISPEGRLLADYRKVNLFEGEVMEGFTTGERTGIFQTGPLASGVSICKDLDFDAFIRRYDRDGIGVLYVPAWDFKKDGWYHARIALLRGVENGYAIVRNARLGRLTVSDPLGRVLNEASTESGQAAAMTGSLRPERRTTLYSRWGDWFAWISLAGACACLLLLFKRRS